MSSGLKAVKSISINSNKGGTGKTTIAVNLAVLLAKKGKNVCLLDTDFQGPSIMTFFDRNVKFINEYLRGEAELSDCLQDISKELRTLGKLFVGFADYSPAAINSMLRVDPDISMRMLTNLISLRDQVFEIPYEVDYLILDSSPGMGLNTINSIMAADISIYVIKLTNLDIDGTVSMIHGISKNLKIKKPNPLIIANMIPEQFIADEKSKEILKSLIENKIANVIGKNKADFLGWIPSDWDFQIRDFQEAIHQLNDEPFTRTILSMGDSKHPFVQTLEKIIKQLE